ncbi:MAG TPA: sn-glycerol-1-phosphate dehydrogenase [Nitrososphaeraceae archaeon]|nr:sn-glycerol-1-phosphate dehydrogenase [Nitrososphaeraceae archaeon]
MKSNTHLMELPRKILVGDNVISDLGNFIRDINNGISNVVIISGESVRNKIENKTTKSLDDQGIKNYWFIRKDASVETVSKLKIEIGEVKSNIILGIGGGKSVDVGKMIAYSIKKPFISIPTSASHDGIASPFVSLKGSNKPHSIKVNTPIGVLADIKLISEAPQRLLSSGCGDLIGKLTAVKDWELARDEKDEYFGTYSAHLAKLSADIIMNKSKELLLNENGVRTIIEALISAGVAAGIAGSSRPCSGSEHLFSHALEYITGGNCGLHGERVGLGTIIMSKLYEMDFENIISVLENVKAPVKANQINLTEKDIIQSLIMAQHLRPERYTILSKSKLDKKSAYELAKSAKVI